MLMKQHPDQFGFSVSHTTRQPRAGEVHGVDYYFATLEEIEKTEMIEVANNHGKIYGTSLMAVEHVLSQGRICILDVDFKGAKSFKQFYADKPVKPVYIFISPTEDTSAETVIDEIQNRLKVRGTETDETLAARLKTAEAEMSFFKEMGDEFYDHVVVNAPGKQTDAVQHLERIFMEETGLVASPEVEE